MRKLTLQLRLGEEFSSRPADHVAGTLVVKLDPDPGATDPADQEANAVRAAESLVREAFARERAKAAAGAAVPCAHSFPRLGGPCASCHKTYLELAGPFPPAVG